LYSLIRDIRWPVVICIILWLWQSRQRANPTSVHRYFYMGIAVLVLAVCSTRFLGFEVNGVDFSIFDWMLHNTTTGQFMYSPVCDCNHFGVHPTWLMLLLVPFHYIFQSPWLLVLVHAGALIFSLVLLRSLLNQFAILTQPSAVLATVLAFFVSQHFGTITNYGFHPEIFYLPLGFWFLMWWPLYGWRWIIPAVLFCLVKEDGALYLVGWGVGCLLTNMAQGGLKIETEWRRGILLTAGSIVFFFINVKLMQPLFWGDSSFRPSWSSFWIQYGQTPFEVMSFVLKNPIQVFVELAHSGIWGLLLSFSFLPILSARAMCALLPGILMLGLANNPVVKGYGVYYAAPMLPFAVFGWIAGLKKICSLSQTLNKRRTWVEALAILILATAGGTGPRLGRLKPDVRHDLEEWTMSNLTHVKADASSQLNVCVQTALWPHLGYHVGVRPLSDPGKCKSSYLIDSRLDPYPFSSAEDMKTYLSSRGGVDLN
jgi:uncharacterized membrane protein